MPSREDDTRISLKRHHFVLIEGKEKHKEGSIYGKLKGKGGGMRSKNFDFPFFF